MNRSSYYHFAVVIIVIIAIVGRTCQAEVETSGGLGAKTAIACIFITSFGSHYSTPCCIGCSSFGFGIVIVVVASSKRITIEDSIAAI